MDLLLTLIWSTHSYENQPEYCSAPLLCIVLHILRLRRRDVDPVLKVVGRGTNLYIHICIYLYNI